MPKKKSSKPPVMRQDRQYACVYIAGKKVFLGKWGSGEAERNYKRVLAEWVSGLGESDVSPEGSVTLDELTLQFLRWAKGYHEIRTYDRFKTALTVMLKLYSGTLVQEFGCRKLLVLQDQYVQMKYARTYVNKLVSCIRQVFSWGVSRELCPVAIAEALEHVPPLKKHKTKAQETTPRLEVADEIVESTLPFLLPTLQEMVKVQRLAGMRPSELWRMRTCDIDQSKDIWVFSPVYHKTEGKGCSRHIALGKEEQEILIPRMARKEPEEYLFSPRDTMQEKWERDSLNRKTKRTPSQIKRHEAAMANPRRKLNDHYTTGSYGKALSRAIEDATSQQDSPVQKWTLYQLRHAFVTETSDNHGRDIARAAAGHKTEDMTVRYDHADLKKSIKAAKKRKRKFNKQNE